MSCKKPLKSKLVNWVQLWAQEYNANNVTGWSQQWLYGGKEINQISTAQQTRKFSSTYYKCVEFCPSDSLKGWCCHPFSPQGIFQNNTAIDAICEKNMKETMFNCPWGIKDILQSSGGIFFPGNPKMVQHIMDEQAKIWFQQQNLCGKGLGFFFPTPQCFPIQCIPGLAVIMGTQHGHGIEGAAMGHLEWLWGTQCAHGAFKFVIRIYG